MCYVNKQYCFTGASTNWWMSKCQNSMYFGKSSFKMQYVLLFILIVFYVAFTHVFKCYMTRHSITLSSAFMKKDEYFRVH